MSKFYNNVKTAILLALLTALILWIGSFWSQQGLIVALVFAGVMNIGAYFFSDKIALASMHAQEVGPDSELYQIVEELAQKASLPMPRVYISPTPAPNAFATGRNPKHAAVCATEGLLRVLNRNEIAGVMAHELAHVKHRDTLIQAVAATVGGAISFFAYRALFFGGSRDQNPLVSLAIFLLGPLGAMLIQAAISRSREFNADTEGARIAGNPMFLATALEKIHVGAQRVPLPVNPALNGMFIIEPLNPMRSVAKLFQTHPPLEERLMNLIGRETTGLFGR